uniref:Reverse transcriptase zinc-binding domain-containing protein n=1 Tax=Cajanus cajan TaxID=3821 RepID=A0A151S8T0_CAJCA|nr:hypothetical protein KK1_027003 [Cajanus cajan]
MKWETITSPKSLGGLGIKDMKCFNASLLAKWRWNLFCQKDTLWSRIGERLLAHIWHLKIPPKVAILQWRLLHNALPSIDNLLRRSIILPPLDSMCVMCNEQPETLPHLFFSCPIADQLWKYYFSWASISTVQPQTMRQHL